ncbi:hypothetical protein PFICI_06496 [Pestalotiopsis fici W106-1]|uniref:SMP-30/Gluconolactonase/LRE-like region domain-containing protein n=1 Tax=Pestalotiopsis fici (strain W106-1 / CGMCC3.15140) TaxID=1229662 RepID=W3X631_PESFW|nr:uncharacterized protein PFICI_06496 [Pestalotiopsis fici W106-1]ETS81494.1 hypothetical protein PFICI_06496 [Pestalotiopsis fici W106-1]
MRCTIGLGILAAISPALAATATQLWNFTEYAVTIENSALRANGQLLLTTFDNASLYTLDTLASSPVAELVAKLPGATAIGGIAAIGTDKYAIVGGIRGNYSYTNETIYTVDFGGNSSSPVIEVVASVPDAIMLNGLASLPAYPHIILATDSRQGAVFRIDTDAGTSELAFEDDLFTYPANATTPLGINGIKVSDGYAYFTNTGQYIFGRIPITDDGYQAGDAEVVTYSDRASGYDWDDFVFDQSGNIFAAQTPNAAGQIFLDGTYATLAGGGNSTFFHRPTSVTVTPDGKTLYVTTGGNTVDGVTYSGQVIEVKL